MAQATNAPLRRLLPWAKGLSALVVLASLSCGGGYGGPPTAPTPPPAPSPAPPAPPPPTSSGVITITSTAVNPGELVVSVGSRVTFTNTDVIPHDIFGGPDPATPDCHEIDAVGFLAPGQSRQTNPFPQARTCEYHDHAHSAYVRGRIVIR